jgi:hypothetical protein
VSLIYWCNKPAEILSHTSQTGLAWPVTCAQEIGQTFLWNDWAALVGLVPRNLRRAGMAGFGASGQAVRVREFYYM